jgi:cytoskeleton protein RodZ
MVDEETPEAALFPERVGDRLRAARVKAGLDLSDVATRTRIPQRHLTAIENGDYSALPALTYCVGFVKSYARAVGADEVELGRDVRAELGYSADGRVDHADYDAVDPARVPGKTLALTGVAIAVLVAGGYGLFRNGVFDGLGSRTGTEVVVADSPAAGSGSAARPAKPAVPAAGQVVLTAMDQVWLQVDDDNQKALISREMKAGETFIVPVNSVNPRLKTSRADKIKVTVGGVEVPPVGPPEKLVKNIAISAAALSARGAEIPAAAPGTPAPQLGGTNTIAPVPKGLAPAPGLSEQN